MQIDVLYIADETGCREVYRLDENRKAVLMYNGSVLKTGYIVIK